MTLKDCKINRKWQRYQILEEFIIYLCLPKMKPELFVIVLRYSWHEKI